MLKSFLPQGEIGESARRKFRTALALAEPATADLHPCGHDKTSNEQHEKKCGQARIYTTAFALLEEQGA